MNQWVAILTEALVAVLLAVTIGYCVILDRRLKALKGDRAALKSVIGELIGATAAAERAIATLREAVGECEHDLGAKLIRGGELEAELAERIGAGRDVLQRIGRITQAATPREAVREAAVPAPAAPAPAPASAAPAAATSSRNRMAEAVARARALSLSFEQRSDRSQAA
ncbi:MAG TPA: DUF6468 domain-containing protein [Hyphomicrobiales bacterium]|nr:DUF6468 domain-containing protein [Hyphomicrobiales bacterium]